MLHTERFVNLGDIAGFAVIEEFKDSAEERNIEVKVVEHDPKRQAAKAMSTASPEYA